MAAYSSELTLRDARQQYFVLNGFVDGGYQAAWVKLKAGPIPIYFPNTKARVRAVKFHDLHHVLTEYETTWSGEAEIGAWEIASGCGRHYPAWLLNLNAFAIGLVLAPRAVYRAFVRGRHTSNLYHQLFDEALLGHAVGALRQELGLGSQVYSSSWRDAAAFVGWSAISLVTFLTPYVFALTVAVAGFSWFRS